MREVIRKHGKSHLPGGSDPIEFPASAGISWAMATQNLTSMSDDEFDLIRPRFDQLATNDSGLFELADISGGKADWVQINAAGYYEARAAVIVTTVFDDTEEITLDLIYSDSPNEEKVSDNLGNADFWGNYGTPVQERLLGDMHTHGTWYHACTFRWDPDDPDVASSLDDQDPLKIAVRLSLIAGGVTKNVGCYLYLARLADSSYTVTTAA